MQKISFGNSEYVRASAIAKQFKYTQDYVGQLCRGDKVDARLVGRVWYVNSESVMEYRKTKHAALKKKPEKKASKERRTVESVVRNKTIRTLGVNLSNTTLSTSQTIKTRYDKDDQAIIPIVNSERKESASISQSAKRPTRVAPTVRIKVKPNSKKSTLYQAEKLPEIRLNSRLKVTDYAETSLANTPSQKEVKDVENSNSSVSKKTNDLKSETSPKKIYVDSNKSTPSATSTFKPKSVENQSSTRSPRLRNSWLIVVCGVLSALLISLVVLGLTDSITAVSGGVNSRYTFNVQSLIESLKKLF